MATYLDGMEGGKHNSDDTIASFTPRKTEEREMLEENLIDTVIEEIKSDISVGDLTAIFELLKFVPVKHLISFLPEEKWETYNSLK